MPVREQNGNAPANTHTESEVPTAPAQGRDFFATMLSLVACVPLGLFLLSFFSPWLMLAELAVNFQVQWLVGLLASGLVLLWFRRWWLALVMLLASSVAFAGIAPVYFPDPSNPPAADTARLRVMSYNVLVHNRRFAEVLIEIRKRNPDLLVIVEYTPIWKEALRPLRLDYPYSLEEPRGHGFGIALFSKRPLIESQTIAGMPVAEEMPALRATVDFAGRPLEIVATHLINPLGNSQLELRDRQFQALAAELVAEPVERVVVGDFNCTTWSQDLREFLVRTGLRDSRQGFGLQPSWSPEGMPFLAIPIDHALVTRGLSVLAREVGAKEGSDHRPVIIDLAWPHAESAATKDSN